MKPFGGWALAATVAALLVLAERTHASYRPTAWGPLGLALVITAAVLVLAGRRPGRAATASAACLVGLGLWSAASSAWGGLPHEGWTTLDKQLLAAAALLAGSALATTPFRAAAVAAGVLAAAAAQAAEILVRLALGHHPDDWLAGRLLDGPVGYHNAQAAALALALPLGLWAATAARPLIRAAGGVSVGLLLGGLLLTQSRGVLLAAAVVGVAAQLLLARRATLVLGALCAALAVPPLVIALRRVDEALLTGTETQRLDALRAYAGWVGLAALALGAAWVLLPRLPASRAVAACAAAVLVAAVLGAGVGERDTIRRELSAVSAVQDDGPPIGAPGATRLASLATNGRRDAWRVAWDMAEAEPLLGHGQGRFAPTWAVERRLDLHLLQPHSVELELLAELGVVGLAAWLLFAVLAVTGLVRSPDRPLAAAALGGFLLVLLQASADWTWSFPAVVAAALLLVGAAIGSGSRLPVPGWARAAVAVGALAALASVSGPFLAAKHLEAGEAVELSDPDTALKRAKDGAKLDPWLAGAVSLRGRLAERAGDAPLAAREFREAASLSQRPWLDRYREARALAGAGLRRESRAACTRALAANPAENQLVSVPCVQGEAGNRWWVRSVRPAGGGFDAFFADVGCAGCRAGLSGDELVVEVAGAADAQDTAYAMRKVAGATRVAATVRLEAGDGLTGNVVLLQVRDRRNALVWELYAAAEDSTLRLWSPAGGLSSKAVNISTGVRVPTDGSIARRVTVSAQPGRSATVAVDGRQRIRLALDAASTSGQRYLRAGIVAYGTGGAPGRVTASYRAIRIAALRR